MSKPLNVAILGFGLSGSTFHAPLISVTKGLQLTHILSRQEDKIKQLYPHVNIVTDLLDILNNPDIDLVINTLPNSEHYAVTKACLLADKHVVVEKPFVINSPDGEELLELATARNLVLSVYHNRRFDNGLLTLVANRDKLGQIYHYEAYFDRFRPTVNLAKWREQDDAGSGILYDLGSHLIDQALYLFGIPQAIFADLAKQRPNAQTIDYFNLTLIYPTHRAILGSSSVISNPRPVIAAYGDKGSYVKYGLDPQENQLKEGITPNDSDYGIEEELYAGKLSHNENDVMEHDLITSLAGSYQEYYQQLYSSIIDGSNPPISAGDGLTVIKLIEKVIQSNMLTQVISITP